MTTCKHNGEQRFRRLLKACEDRRKKLPDGLRREVCGIRKHLKIHNWFHYSRTVEAAARRLNIECCDCTA